LFCPSCQRTGRREKGNRYSENLQGAGRDREELCFLEGSARRHDVFLKTPRRIEAMGLVLVLASALAPHGADNETKAKEEHIALRGWNNAGTLKPTSFMMASKFSPVFVGLKAGRRFLLTPLDKVQLAYLSALDVHPLFSRRRPGERGHSFQGAVMTRSQKYRYSQREEVRNMGYSYQIRKEIVGMGKEEHRIYGGSTPELILEIALRFRERIGTDWAIGEAERQPFEKSYVTMPGTLLLR